MATPKEQPKAAQPAKPAPAGKASVMKLRIRLKSYDQRLLDRSTADILDTAKRTGSGVVGPIPLPTRIEKYTVLRSPNIDKKSREQYEIRTHKRVLYILAPTGKTIESLKNMTLPAGVDINVKQ